MILFVLRAGETVPLPQIAIFVALSLLGLALVTRFVLAISSISADSTW